MNPQARSSSNEPQSDRILADRYSARFFAIFSWYVQRMFRKNFHGVHLDPSSVQTLDRLNSHPGPAIALGNHPGWWDPLVAVLLTRLYLPDRPMLAAMDRAELERFAILRRLGIFGIDPDDPRSLQAQTEFLGRRFTERPRATFWITPQGRFTDVREDIRLRPGAAAVAARLDPEPMVVALAMDYCFWNDRKPELCMRVIPVHASARSDGPLSTTDWVRAMTSTMRENQNELTKLTIRRDPQDWLQVIAPRQHQKTNPVYDLWLRLRGRSGQLRTHRDREQP
jgi:1-acyl-sn-glycerol-3-phosphate acyltransferase